MRGRTALMVAAVMGLGSIAGAQGSTGQMIEKAALSPQQPRGNTLRAIFGGGLGGGSGRTERRSGPGWSTRQVQRMALKKRNQARHRASCRGRARSRA